MNLHGKTVFVTGANRGIGAVFVQAFLDAGAAKVYAAMRTAAPSSDPRVVPVALDVTDDAQVEAAARACADVDVLVNNAGLALGERLVAARDPKAAKREMDVNYFGTLAMVRAFAPVLRARGGGAIVNVSSILGRVNLPGAGSYSASKAATYSLTQGVRAELRGQGTLVVGIMPSFVETEMTAGVAIDKISPREVADAAVRAVIEGTEDVYPGPAADVAIALAADGKAVERSFASMLPLH